MNGRPVWLASLSRRDADNEIIGTGKWSKRERKRLTQYLRSDVLGALGDPTCERVFRMNITLCVHRLCTPAEAAWAMQRWEGTSHRDLAGQPVEILEEVGCVSDPSTHPCADPGHLVIVPERPDLWVPQDCGKCETCLARKRHEDAL
jgi:hypothetical protein